MVKMEVKTFFTLLADSIGMGFLAGTTLVMMVTFMIAFLSPDKMVLVTINTYHEAVIELVFLIILLPFGVRTVHQYITEER
jgi:hypothetical protein